jgi:hypothetical protein
MALAKVKLSGSTDGKPIPIVQTATAGTTIHTVGSALEELWIWVSNVTATAATLTIEYGGASDPGNHLVKALSIPANSGPICVCPGLVLGNSLAVKMFSGTASALNAHGYAITGV